MRLLALLFLAFCASPLSSEAKKVLFLAPNFLTPHFENNARVANVLANDGHQVHFVILNTANVSGEQKQSKRGVGAEVHCEYFDFSAEFLRGHGFDSNPSPMNKWRERAHKQDKQIVLDEAFHVFKEFAHSPMMDSLEGHNFDWGIADVWDLGALHIFHLLGIGNTLATSNMQLMSFQMAYARTLDKLPPNVPELFGAQIGDASPDQEGLARFKKEHTASVTLFSDAHREMDDWFSHNYATHHLNWRPSAQLYRNSKSVLLDSDPLLDFDLGEGKPQNMRHIGGLHLIEGLRSEGITELDRSQFPNVLVSFGERCVQMPLATLRAFMLAFSQFGGSHAFFVDACPQMADKLFQLEYGYLPPRNVFFYYKEAAPSKRQHILANEHGEQDGPKDLFKRSKQLKDIGAFVSMCDNESALEALAAGIPLICVPFAVDQFYIGEALARRGAAISLNAIEITEKAEQSELEQNLAADQIAQTIGKVIGGKEYLTVAKQMQLELHKRWAKASPQKTLLGIVAGEQDA